MGFPPITTPAAGSITNAMLADMAASRAKGRAAGAGTGVPTDLTPTQLTALLNAFSDTLQGAAPASGGGTANFLRADGSWQPPPAGSLTGHGVSVQNSADQSVANNTTAAVLFDTEHYDTDGYHSTSSNKDRFTVPAGLAGYYLVSAFHYWAANSSGERIAFIGFAVNNSTHDNVEWRNTAYGGGNSYSYVAVSGICYIEVGAAINTSAYQRSGGNLSLLGTGSQFAMSYLGA